MRDLTRSSLRCYSNLSLSTRIRGWVKSNATNDVKWKVKVGLHFCLLQTFKVLSFYRYTKFKSFNPILEDFLIVLFGYTSSKVKCGSTYLFAESIFSTSMIYLETREEKKVTGGYIRRIGWMS